MGLGSESAEEQYGDVAATAVSVEKGAENDPLGGEKADGEDAALTGDRLGSRMAAIVGELQEETNRKPG